MVANPAPPFPLPDPSLTNPLATAQAPAIRRRSVRLLLAWVLVGVGAFLLALPWDIAFTAYGTRFEWTYEGLTGLALAALGFGLLVTTMRSATLDLVEKHRREFGAILFLAGFGIAVLYAIKAGGLPGLGVMGLVVLATALVAGNFMSGEDAITAEEIRTAVTLAIVSVFLGVLALGDDLKVDEGGALKETLDHFWTILLTVVGFYFTTTAVESAAKTLANRKE